MLFVQRCFVIKRHTGPGQYDLFAGDDQDQLIPGGMTIVDFQPELRFAYIFRGRAAAVEILNRAGRGEFSLRGAHGILPPAPIDGLEIVDCTITRAISERKQS